MQKGIKNDTDEAKNNNEAIRSKNPCLSGKCKRPIKDCWIYISKAKDNVQLYAPDAAEPLGPWLDKERGIPPA